MIIIGEKINGSIPSVAEAIANRDAEFIKDRARKQAEANATFIDCCASVPEEQEVETLKWMIDCIQEVTDLPISVDSPSADVLAQAYKFCKRPGLFNSVSGEGDKIDKIFPIMAQEENKDWQHGITLKIADTAGIRQTEDIVEKIGVSKAKEMAADADLILYVVDSSVPLDENDEEIIKILQEKKTIVLYSKTDLKSAIDIEDLKSRINQPVIPISAKEETGITDLEEKIREMFFSGEINFNDEVYITNERHRQELLKAQESLSLVENSIESGMPEDFYSIDLTDAYESLGRILGESLGEDLVNEIFSKFCMGK